MALLRKSMESKDYQVATAQDGMEGFILAKRDIPDLIILDVHMPNLDGYSLVRQLKGTAELKSVPVLIVTADDKLEERFRKLGVSHYLKKPFTAEKILEQTGLLLKANERKF